MKQIFLHKPCELDDVPDTVGRIQAAFAPSPSQCVELDAFFARRPSVALRLLWMDAGRDNWGFLAALPHLRHLVMDACSADELQPSLHVLPPALTSLSLQCRVPVDLAPLMAQRALVELHVESAGAATSLLPLAGHPSLSTVSLSGKIRGHKTASTWPALTTLAMALPAPGLSAIGPLPTVKRLHISARQARDMSALSSMPRLAQLSLVGLANDGDGLRAVRASPLQQLSLASMKNVVDLSWLRGHPTLSSLTLHQLQGLRTLDGIETLRSLTAISTSGSFSSQLRLDGLLRSTSLRSLSIYGAGIEQAQLRQVAEAFADRRDVELVMRPLR
jgi:hypothetical protein